MIMGLSSLTKFLRPKQKVCCITSLLVIMRWQDTSSKMFFWPFLTFLSCDSRSCKTDVKILALGLQNANCKMKNEALRKSWFLSWKLKKWGIHWRARNMPNSNNMHPLSLGGGGAEMEKMRFRYYVVNHVSMMFSLLVLSFTIFTFDPIWNIYRIGNAMTLLLVAVTFKLSVAGTLPPISYLTYLDVSWPTNSSPLLPGRKFSTKCRELKAVSSISAAHRS